MNNFILVYMFSIPNNFFVDLIVMEAGAGRITVDFLPHWPERVVDEGTLRAENMKASRYYYNAI